ncbi:Multidrug resistance protein [Aduncisulcus paluster]|uniref:Multidrug resistance protein n=1 Tax=Aduncisulcus paluster TaxID=2918883 RepID=A0ABQ5K5C1_9EUKA|nr:Multidrug resistance protein [Aduncisulcus paluster]
MRTKKGESMSSEQMTPTRSPAVISDDLENDKPVINASNENQDSLRKLETNSNFFGRYSFSFLTPLLKKAKKDDFISLDDLPDVCNYYEAGYNGEKADNIVLQEKQKMIEKDDGREIPSLFKCMLKLSKGRIIGSLIFFIFFVVLSFVPAILLQYILAFIDDIASDSPQKPLWHGFIYAGIYFLNSILFTFCQGAMGYLLAGFSQQVSAGLSEMIYRKLLRINESSKSLVSAGKTIQILVGDTNNVSTILRGLNATLGVIPILVVGLTLLVIEVGWPSLVGVGVFLFVIPFQGIASGKYRNAMFGALKASDSRVRQTNEIITGMKTVKMNAYEGVMWRRIAKSRQKEISNLRTLAYIRAFLTFFFNGTQLIMLFFTLLMINLIGEELTPTLAYQTIAFFGAIRDPLIQLPWLTVNYQTFKVSASRIMAFLMLPEREKRAHVPQTDAVETVADKPHREWALKVDGPVSFHRSVTLSHELAVLLYSQQSKLNRKQKREMKKKFKAQWTTAMEGKSKAEVVPFALWYKSTLENATIDKSPYGKMKREEEKRLSDRKAAVSDAGDEPVPDVRSDLFGCVLHDIDLTLYRGSLTGIVGKVGCGKSSILLALMGELNAVHHHQETHVSPVLVSGSVCYCAQTPFILNATLRDNILFGKEYDKKRYNQVIKKCCLLPDIKQLKHGDMTEIGERGFTLSGGQKARVSLARAVYSDSEIYLLDDPLSAVDAYVGKKLVRDVICGLLKDKTVILVTHQVQFISKCDHILAMKDGRIVANGTLSEISAQGIDLEGAIDVLSEEDGLRGEEEEEEEEEEKDDEKERGADKSRGEEEEEEIIATKQGPDASSTQKRKEKKKPVPSSNLIKAEIHKKGAVKFAVFKFFFQSVGSGTLFFMGLFFVIQTVLERLVDVWIAQWSAGKLTVFGITFNPLLVYGVLAALAMGSSYGASILLQLMCNKASEIILMRMTSNVLKAPMHFFETTTVGQITNRFTKDIGGMDMLMPSALGALVLCASGIIGIVILQCIAVPPLVLVYVCIFIFYFVLLNLYRPGVREMKRCEAISKSPMLSKLTESIDGLLTIRAYGHGNRFEKENVKLINANTRAAWPNRIAANWVSFRLGIIASFLQLFLVAFVVILSYYNIMVTFVGMALSYSFNFVGLMAYFLQNVAKLEAEGAGLERIREYVMECDRESVMVYRESTHGRDDLIQDHSTKNVVKDVSLHVKEDAQREIELTGSSDSEGVFGEGKDGKKGVISTEMVVPDLEEVGHYGESTEKRGRDIVSVIREETFIQRYTSCIPSPSSHWPISGEMVVSNLHMRYRPKLPLVLNGVSFHLKPGEKLGICGRTGSGKSSLISCLLRIVEPEVGSVTIDGIDLSRLSLHDARSSMSVIPQEGFLFSGTLRENLHPISPGASDDGGHKISVDPSLYCKRVMDKPTPSDAQLWSVLEKVCLKDFVEADEDKLDMKIADNGSNLSQGQRQLVCLARSLLANAKVLLLDEATASLDNESDTAIQKVLREEFAHCTLLTVAHRLHTVIDYDRVMVLGDGRVLEIGIPHELLESDESEFAFLVKETGKENEEFLRKKAKEVFDASSK